ncbi:ribosome small subunit-dependent GTPase A [Limosilactobacillus vaginalis]|uniref:Small ribosomal subunit biogenesis GTPase RsgA n=2 Tax=Limosilactobacillus vaginalis TaxID=1633 RepID=A0AAW5WUB4_9LACO|nr:ribosome small subunit-dependent GTPase A [Limosilactobacillus vaginalis]EEJ39840.1 ribosome small subunit-dependent GTPase A [Limosilactobacillus vaginalis DSM 5837 = ATCC 49540]KRM46309.1 GTP-binding protein [Limosilactobacillus vaginalis DSM 5837 = ATCC 49540]MCZ3668138.1 ribosome small subunit-dependent GTPase A [Limosilactobacillus vaginalis]MCZ3746199.1 ribosome small subunit-dependent GTPase A [Limosilactobacillus vaginalis]MCZ3751181.1 ribosome small subunit-dependent GTPase A [Limo
MKQGIIQQSLSGFYDILADGEIYRTRARGNFRARKIKPIVGDRVEFENGYLLHVLPRKNELVRPPVANVDIAVVVTAAKKPTFSTNLLDRQLIALEAQKIIPVIYFSKTDLLDDDEYAKLAEIVDGYRKIGYQIFFSREAFAEDQLHQLKELLKDQIVTMMGQTGAGKSTLLNHFAPGLDLATGEISTALKRGRHTTRKVSLLNVACAWIADTPGFSSYETFDMTVEELPNFFPEMKELAPNCKFRGCLHLKEPQCAVKDAVKNGIIMKSRYDDYVQFHNLIANQKPDYGKNKK